MAGMQQIEAAVGKTDFEPMAAPSSDQIEGMRARHDLVGGMQIPAIEGGYQLACINDSRSDFADDNAGGGIRETRRIGQADTDRERCAHRGHDSVASPGDIVDLAHFSALYMDGAVG